MKIYSYSTARQNLAGLLDAARNEEVIITRRDGSRFRVVPLAVSEPRSPFDIEGADCAIGRDEIVATIRKGRERGAPGKRAGGTRISGTPDRSRKGPSSAHERHKKNSVT